MLIDFSPVEIKELTLYEFAQKFSRDDFRHLTNASLNTMLEIIGDGDDAQLTFIPDDPDADDPLAPPEEQHLGWSVAHLVAHVTASCEEWATYSSILARGIGYPREPRLRYETDWHRLKTREKVLQRIEESRRMRLACLDLWADEPHLDSFRETSEQFVERNGAINAKSAFLFGLRHEQGHMEQFRETANKAREAAART